MYCLTINFQSIQLNNNIIHGNDKVKINVITYPGNEKQSFIIDANNMNDINNFVKLTITHDFKKLIFIFERKNIFQMNPMIASRAIDRKKIPKSPTDINNTEQKTFGIYKPIRSQDDVSDINSRIVGKMTLQFNITEQFYIKNKKNPYHISKIHNGEGYSNVNENNLNENNIWLLDDEFVN